jgi:hypothetical protein
MLSITLIQCLLLALLLILTVQNERVNAWMPTILRNEWSFHQESYRPQFQRGMTAIGSLQMTASEQDSKPTTFREAEVLGLRLMQEGKFEAALKGEEKKIHFRLNEFLRENPCFLLQLFISFLIYFVTFCTVK